MDSEPLDAATIGISLTGGMLPRAHTALQRTS